MDCVWLIFDSLSYEATPFADSGPDTMPRLEALASESGVVFENAYVPGPASPSSHASFFTGKLPSEVGMHEAYPHFDGRHRTIVDALNDSHHTSLVTTNPFVWNGLNRAFNETDNLQQNEYLLFEDATDPVALESRREEFESTLRKYLMFLMEGGKPVRSLLNGISYKRWEKSQSFGHPNIDTDELMYQYAGATAERIRQFRDTDQDSFVFANCMDVHAPLNATDKAIERFCSGRTREELPIGNRGVDVHEQAQAGDTELADKMYDLYKASIWDLDRKMGSVVEELLEDDAMVVVTADHGNWFRRDRGLDERRLHVPLVVFAPDESQRIVDHTVNIRHLPATITDVLLGANDEFEGESLLSVTENQLSITEYIHKRGDGTVHPTGTVDPSEIVYDLAAIRDDARLDYEDDQWYHVRGSKDDTEELRAAIEDLRARDVSFGSKEEIRYDASTEQRLKDLGYIS